MDTRILEKAGFTDGEARVYIALLELGVTSSSSIANRSGVSRSKVYEILGRLKKKGMATETYAGGIRHFVPASPSRIFDYLSRQERDIAERKEELALSLPSLLALQKGDGEPEDARMYSGLDGIRALYEEELSRLAAGDEYLEFISYESPVPDASFLRFLSKFHAARAKRKARAKALAPPGAALASRYMDFSHIPLSEFRLSRGIFPVSVAIFPSAVVTLEFGERPRAFAIRSYSNAARHRKFFLSEWSRARKKPQR